MSKYIKQADENAEMGMRTQIEPIIEVSEDCISREWVLEEYQKGEEKIGESEFFAELMWLVKHAPSVVPTVRKNRTVEQSSKVGEWVEHKYAEEYNGLMQSNFECSQCHDWLRERTNYCPNCGAKMKV